MTRPTCICSTCVSVGKQYERICPHKFFVPENEQGIFFLLKADIHSYLHNEHVVFVVFALKPNYFSYSSSKSTKRLY